MPPCASWIEAFRQRPTTLHVHLVDRLSPRCASPSDVTVFFDGEEIGHAGIACGPVPAHAVRLDGPKVMPGLHEIAVRAESTAGRLETAAVVSLPAFDVAGDGESATLGSEIRIDVSAEDVLIEPPLVYPPQL